jgi:hypothetical protein
MGGRFPQVNLCGDRNNAGKAVEQANSVVSMNTAAGTNKAANDDQAGWEAAAKVRKGRPGWVVIWLARKGESERGRNSGRHPDTVASVPPPRIWSSR